MFELVNKYTKNLTEQLEQFDWAPVEVLANILLALTQSKNQLFIIGNGGSAGNAAHLANDFIYGLDPTGKLALNVEALTSNPSVLTCLGNDIGYKDIFSHQIKVKAKKGDVLLALSGSGNSPNVLAALEQAKIKGVTTSCILGFQGGDALNMCDIPIHFPIDDMQISEDLQIIVGHILMRHLNNQIKES